MDTIITCLMLVAIVMIAGLLVFVQKKRKDIYKKRRENAAFKS